MRPETRKILYADPDRAARAAAWLDALPEVEGDLEDVFDQARLAAAQRMDPTIGDPMTLHEFHDRLAELIAHGHGHLPVIMREIGYDTAQEPTAARTETDEDDGEWVIIDTRGP